MITIEKYRKILGDYTTADELVQKRIDYLTAFCRNIAKNEIENYVKKQSITKE